MGIITEDTEKLYLIGTTFIFNFDLLVVFFVVQVGLVPTLASTIYNMHSFVVYGSNQIYVLTIIFLGMTQQTVSSLLQVFTVPAPSPPLVQDPLMVGMTLPPPRHQ